MATITITTLPSEDVRIAAAYGSFLSLGRPATGPEIKARILADITQAVKQYETTLQQSAVVVIPISPS